MRWVYIAVGLAALAASTAMNVHTVGGVASEAALGLMAMAMILAIGSAAIGHALAGRHVAIAVVIGLGMLAGEIGALVSTAQRVTAARSTMRAPILEAEANRRAAAERLARAEEAIARADAEIAAKAALPGCKVNCRQLLQEAKDNAVGERNAARVALAAIPAPLQSATALADATGWRQWVLDCIEALAISLAVNLPASALIALGVKMGAKREEGAFEAAMPGRVELLKPVSRRPRSILPAPKSAARSSAAEAERFGLAMLRPDQDGRLDPGALRAAYLKWCEAEGRDPLPMGDIAPALGILFRRARIEIDGNGIAKGVAIRPL